MSCSTTITKKGLRSTDRKWERDAGAVLHNMFSPLQDTMIDALEADCAAFMKGSWRNAVRLTLREADRARSEADVLGLSGAGKAFLLPRMLLHRLPRGGLIAESSLSERLQSFTEGNWSLLLRRAGIPGFPMSSETSRRRGQTC